MKFDLMPGFQAYGEAGMRRQPRPFQDRLAYGELGGRLMQSKWEMREALNCALSSPVGDTRWAVPTQQPVTRTPVGRVVQDFGPAYGEQRRCPVGGEARNETNTASWEVHHGSSTALLNRSDRNNAFEPFRLGVDTPVWALPIPSPSLEDYDDPGWDNVDKKPKNIYDCTQFCSHGEDDPCADHLPSPESMRERTEIGSYEASAAQMNIAFQQHSRSEQPRYQAVQRLLERAWAYLVYNVDLVKYAACCVDPLLAERGSAGLSHLMEAMLSESGLNFIIFGPDMTVGEQLSTGIVNITNVLQWALGIGEPVYTELVEDLSQQWYADWNSNIILVGLESVVAIEAQLAYSEQEQNETAGAMSRSTQNTIECLEVTASGRILHELAHIAAGIEHGAASWMIRDLGMCEIGSPTEDGGCMPRQKYLGYVADTVGDKRRAVYLPCDVVNRITNNYYWLVFQRYQNARHSYRCANYLNTVWPPYNNPYSMNLNQKPEFSKSDFDENKPIYPEYGPWS